MASNFVAFDFETANYQSDSACSVGLVKVENFQITQQEYFLIRPPYRNFAFTHIHGLKWSDVQAAPDFGSLWSKVSAWFTDGSLVVAHNVRFDQRVLKACCERYEISLPDLKYRCTVQMARQQLGISPANLPAVCASLRIPLDHHNAMSDALACAKIAITALKMDIFQTNQTLDASHDSKMRSPELKLGL
jgi:DNA polymerase-3 subunit epsilon